MKKKWISLALLVTFLFTMGGGAMAKETTNDKLVVNTGADPLWSIDKVIVDEKIGVGKEFNVQFQVRNMGTGVGINPIIEFSEVDGNGLENFEIVNGEHSEIPNAFDLGILEVSSGESRTVNVKMKVKEETKERPSGYKIKAVIKSQKWSMPTDNPVGNYGYGISTTFTVKPMYVLSKPTFVVEKVEFNPTQPNGKDPVKATLHIKNISETKARNVTVALTSEAQSEGGKKNFDILDLSNTQHVGDLGGKGLTKVTFNINPEDERTSNEIKLTIKYDGQETPHEEIINLPLPKHEKEKTIGKKPKVIISKYTVSPSKILAGNEVSLQLYIENTNTKPVNNINIALKVPENEDSKIGGTVFSPINSSNTFHINYINGNSVIEKEIKLHVDANAQAKTYIVPVSIDYEDEDGNELTSSDNVNIPVTQESKVEVTNATIPDFANAGMPVFLSLDFVNTGKVPLTNFKVALEGEAPIEENVYFVGTLEAGAQESYQGEILPSEEGIIEGKVVISYIDANNQDVRVEKPFTIEVGPMIDPGPMPGEGEFPEEPSGGIMAKLKENWLAILLGVIIIGQGIFMYRWKKKANEDEELLDA